VTANSSLKQFRESHIPTGSPGEGFLRTSSYEYGPEDLRSICDSFWWLCDYMGGLTPSQFYIKWNRPELASNPNDKGYQRALTDYVRAHRQNARLDYSDPTIFTYFDQAYFYRNFLKCLVGAHLISALYPRLARSKTVIDVGSGVGTFAIACQLIRSFPQANYLIVDQCTYQIEIARFLISHLLFENFKFRQADAFQEFSRRGLLISSYWLCGNKEGVLKKSDEELRFILRDGMVLIDYDINIMAFKERIKSLRPRLHQCNVHAPLIRDVQQFVGSRDLNVHMLIVDRFDATQSTPDL